MYFDESDQASIVGLIYNSMSEENREKFFGKPKNREDIPLESYRFIILDVSKDAQDNNTSSSLPI